MEAIKLGWKVLTRWDHFHILAVLVLAAEAAICAAAIRYVPYTEIDWKAYMQEVGGYLGGELDYMKLRGDTGPLVYPAGFVWLYSALYYLAGSGPQGENSDIFLMQCLFGILLVVTLAIVLAIYAKARPAGGPWIVLILLLSKRLHSIFVLRLFNDGPAMALALAALLCFMNRRWVIGCVLFSLGVSVKMNVLLFAPALLLLLIRNAGGWIGAIQHIALCGIIQVVVGAPFLLAHPVSYIARSFELGRVFTHVWTVNLKFLPEDVFVDRRVGLALLAAHLGALGLLGVRWFGTDVTKWGQRAGGKHDSPRLIAFVMFVCNFVGIVFAKSLHAQFWCWYAFSLPLLAAESSLGVTLALPLLAGMDYAFGYVWPTTPMSSAVLQVCHLLLLVAIAAAPLPTAAASVDSEKPRLRGKAKAN